MQNTNIDTEEIVENGGYISKLFLNNGKEIDINKNDIVIFVGPNNAGKSQALKDILILRILKYDKKIKSILS